MTDYKHLIGAAIGIVLGVVGMYLGFDLKGAACGTAAPAAVAAPAVVK